MSAPAASAAGAAAASVLSSVPRGVAMLRAWQPAVPFEVRPYPYIEKGGTAASSAALGLNEHAVVKTLLFQEREDLPPIVLLQHGDASADTKRLIKELQRTRGMCSGGPEGSPLRSAPDAVAAEQAAAGGKKSKDRVMLCPAEKAELYSGYLFGGTSPFGLHDPTLRVFIEASLLTMPPCAETEYQPGHVTDTALPKEDAHMATYRVEVEEWRAAQAAAPAAAEPPKTLPPFESISPAWVCINGGARGTLVALSVRSIAQVLQPIPISVAKPQKAAASPSPTPAAAAESAPAASASPQP